MGHVDTPGEFTEEPITTTELIRTGIPEFSDDSKKAVYLSYRISNFSVRESCKLTDVSMRQVHRWRAADDDFAHIDGDGLTELRKSMANEYLDMQFTRNFRMVMEKDFRVLYKDATGDELSAVDVSYLHKIRQHYTPQSLAMVKQLLNGGTVQEPFDYTKLTLEIQREHIIITQETQ